MKRRIFFAVLIVIAVALITVGMIMEVRHLQIKSYEKNAIYLPAGFTITAHTGCNNTKDNSIASMKTGVSYGADIVEFDVSIYNGEPVMSHDTPKGNELSVKEAFDFLSSQDTTKANVDLKTSENISKIYTYAKTYKVTNKIFFTGVEDVDVANVKEQCPGIPYYLNISIDKSKNEDDAYISSLISKVRNFGAVGINANYKGGSAKLTQEFQNSGLLVSYWGANDELSLNKVLEFSPDNITTKDPKMLTEIIKKRS